MIIESVTNLGQHTTPDDVPPNAAAKISLQDFTFPVSSPFRCSLCCLLRDLETRECHQITPRFDSTIRASFLPSIPATMEHYWPQSNRFSKPGYFVFAAGRGLYKRQMRYYFDRRNSNSTDFDLRAIQRYSWLLKKSVEV